jgi:hypothetical protein
MKILHLAVVLLALSLLLPACKGAGPTDSVDHHVDTAPPKQAPDDRGPGLPPPEPAKPLRVHVSEWVEIGLSEEQIRAKITDGQGAGHLQATPLTEEDAEALKAAGASDELIGWLKALDLSAPPASP